jgi:hypothetical protein
MCFLWRRELHQRRHFAQHITPPALALCTTQTNPLCTTTTINQHIVHYDNNQPTHCTLRQQSTNMSFQLLCPIGQFKLVLSLSSLSCSLNRSESAPFTSKQYASSPTHLVFLPEAEESCYHWRQYCPGLLIPSIWCFPMGKITVQNAQNIV